MRVCIVFDCLYPYTIGGAERWYRNLSERLAARGHEVTYLTLRQWPTGESPEVPGVRVVAVAPAMGLYSDGRRSFTAQAAFAGGVLAHLLRHGRRYDVVHTAALHLAALAAMAPRRLGRFRLVVDWFEVWTRAYWREYAGAVGSAAWRGELLSLRVPQHAFCFSRLHEQRLRELGFRHELTRLGGLYAGPLDPPGPRDPDPLVVFAGRQIPEKQVTALVPALALARTQIPDLRAEIFGNGPEHDELLRTIDAEGLADVVDAPGFVPAERVEESFRRALCHVLPSRREGYGLVVIDAASRGAPSVVVAAPDNAAVELVDDGVNGVVAPSAAPADLAAAIERVADAGPELRHSTSRWFADNAERLSIDSSLDAVVAAYAR